MGLQWNRYWCLKAQSRSLSLNSFNSGLKVCVQNNNVRGKHLLPRHSTDQNTHRFWYQLGRMPKAQLVALLLFHNRLFNLWFTTLYVPVRPFQIQYYVACFTFSSMWVSLPVHLSVLVEGP